MTEIKTSDLRGEMAAGLPDGYILSKDVVFPDKEIPIKAEVNGKKVTVGSGRVDPETGIFTGTLDPDNEYATVLRGQIEGDVSTYHPFLNVEAVELAQVRKIVGAQLYSISLDKELGPYGRILKEKGIDQIQVLPTGQAIIEEKDPDGPMPKFHDHD